MSKLTLDTITERLDVHLSLLAHNYTSGYESDLHKALIYELMVDCKFPLQFIADGAFREAYRIVGTPYVVKIPSSGSRTYVNHAQADINAYELINDDPKMNRLRKYLPKIHYSNHPIGVILTDYVRPLSKVYNSDRVFTYHGHYRDEIQHVARMAKKLSSADDPDMDLNKLDNFGSVGGQLKILDLGCFTGESC